MKRIVLIGDSIRMGYCHVVKDAFEGIAEVFYPNENCRFTQYMIRHLSNWKDEMGCGNDVDLVHFNVGLWDDLVLMDGKPLNTLDEYTRNLDRICTMLQMLFPSAKLIFATSTPVIESLFKGVNKRYNRDTVEYNRAAIEVVRKYGAQINDLYAYMDAQPLELHSDLTHYQTREGTKVISERVIDVIKEVLRIPSVDVDYDKYETLTPVGI